MILTILVVVLPVFLVIGGGFAASRAGVFHPAAVDGLMLFTQNFAIPCLLFRALVDLDLAAAFDPGLLVSFYAGSVVAFGLGILGARRLFHRRPGEAVAIGFGALFSNSVLLGLPIMERAYGAAALAPNFAIVSIHAPFCYLLGITAMEFARADGRGLGGTARAVAQAMFRNALMIGLIIGFAVNLSGLPVPGTVRAAVDMMADAALPAALFGLGGVLTRYAIRASLAEAAMIAALSLVLHPALTYALAARASSRCRRISCAPRSSPPPWRRGSTPTSSPACIPAARPRRRARCCSATALSVLTVSAWLALLGGVR